jgi:predicted XRE-type DNA-binding protein
MQWYRHGDPTYCKRHGKTGSPEYMTWRSMINRCTNPEHKNYKHYGGRGIKICHRWRTSFINFYSDMGSKPFDSAQIDRIDNDGDYEPGNCRWVSCAENNRKSSRIVLSLKIAREIRNKIKSNNISQRQIATEYGTDQSTVSRIITNRIWRENETRD